jgi:hypothetical protein
VNTLVWSTHVHVYIEVAFQVARDRRRKGASPFESHRLPSPTPRTSLRASPATADYTAVCAQLQCIRHCELVDLRAHSQLAASIALRSAAMSESIASARIVVDKPVREIPQCASSLTRMVEYRQLPRSAFDWMHRHRDQPCVFRSADAYLFEATQLGQIGTLFAPRWQHDAGNLMLSCLGTLCIEQPREVDRENATCRPPSLRWARI